MTLVYDATLRYACHPERGGHHCSYDVWDIDSGNMLGSYPTRAEAEAFVARLVEAGSDQDSLYVDA